MSTTTLAKRYVLRCLGHKGHLVSQRYTLQYQAIDKIVAVTVPQGEASRLFGETGGNTVSILAPMADALKAKGYETFMVVPSQTEVVELVEMGKEALSWEDVFQQASEVEKRSGALLAESILTLMRMLEYLKAKDPGAYGLNSEITNLIAKLSAEYVSKG